MVSKLKWSWKKIPDGKTYIEGLSPIERISFILNKIAESSDYDTVANYFALFNSPEVPTTVEEIKRYLKGVTTCIFQRILQNQQHIYAGVPDEEIKGLYKPIKSIFEKSKDKKVLPYEGNVGHIKMHPLLMELYDLSKDQKIEISVPGSPAILQLTLDSDKTDSELLSDELYLAMNEKDVKLAFNLEQLPEEFKNNKFERNYKLKPIEKPKPKEEPKPKEVHEFSAKDLAPST